jgi:hypothetical protein
MNAPTESLCPFVEIRLSVPRKFILKVFHKQTYLTNEETAKTREKLEEIEKILNQANHIKSLIEKGLLKESNPPPIE